MRRSLSSYVLSYRSSGIATRLCGVLGVMALSVVTAVAATTPPVLWTVGGVDAGTGGAGQASRIAIDTAGNVAVVSGPAGGRLLAVSSYTAEGVLRWRATAAPASGTYVGDWIAIAPGGDVLAVGHSLDSRGRTSAVTLLRYSASGALQWRVDSTGTVLSFGRLLVDAGGNAYFSYNATLSKYAPSGSLLWSVYTAMADGSAAFSPDGADIVLTDSPSGGALWMTAAFNASTGARRWLVSAAEGTAALDVAVDVDRVYVAGQGVTGAGTPAIAYHMTVVAYDRATGARLWRTDKRPAGSASAAGLRIALAPDGSLVVTGQALRGFLDWYTVAYDTSGFARWEAVRDGGASAVLAASIFHFGTYTLDQARRALAGAGAPVRAV